MTMDDELSNVVDVVELAAPLVVDKTAVEVETGVISQFEPLNPPIQEHSKFSPTSRHAPPFKQGADEQGPTSQLTPEYPGLQVHS